MPKRKNQEQFVINQLLYFGEVSRNQCLRHNITRLSAIALDLKKAGWKFTAKSRGGDYVYTLTDEKQPLKVEKIYVAEEHVSERVVTQTI